METYDHHSTRSRLARLKKRALTIFGPHLTPQRLYNFLRAEWDRLRLAPRLGARPYVLFTEISSVCNLRCPGCLSHDPVYAKGFMALSDFRRVIDHFAPWLIDLELYGWGEPFLNRDIFEMIAHARRRRLFVRTSSNFNRFEPGDAERIVRSGLGQLNASLDGATQATYAAYRVGASLDLALDNLRALVAAKRKLGSRTPILEWQFIVSRVNQHEVEAARQMAHDAGVDIFRLDLPFSLAHIDRVRDPEAKKRWLADDPAYRQWEGAGAPDAAACQRPCAYLWNTLQVDVDGDVNPCPNRRGSQVKCGRALSADPRDLWNQEVFIRSRRLFASRPSGPPLPLGPCPGCAEARQPWKSLWPADAARIAGMPVTVGLDGPDSAKTPR